jgi:hypothetical protein
MPIDPQEDPPINPGKPTEPPQESPPGNPRPEVPPPMQEPGEQPRPEELPGKMPDELPVRGPEGPRTPYPTDGGVRRYAGSTARSRSGHIRHAAGDNVKFGLKRSSECAMNRGASGLSVFTNKNQSAFEGRHNPA